MDTGTDDSAPPGREKRKGKRDLILLLACFKINDIMT
jgi:hypothetical protein